MIRLPGVRQRSGGAGVLQLAAVFSVMAVSGVFCQEVAQPGARPAPIEAGATIRLLVGQSTVIRAPWNIKRISVTDPKVADVQPLTPDQVLLLGKGPGSTDLTLWSETEEVRQARVEVQEDLAQVEERLRGAFPDSQLQVTRSRDVIIVKGTHPRTEHTEQLRTLLETLGYKFVDLTTVAGVHQVQIQVRVAEVSRTAIRTLGINAFHTGPHFFGGSTVGTAGGGALNTINVVPTAGAPAGPNLPFIFSPVGVSPLVTLFTGFPDIDLEIFFQALAENQYLRPVSYTHLTLPTILRV